MPDGLGAFVPGPAAHVAGAAAGPLAGLTFAAKDIFDVAGTVTGCGSPAWRDAHGPARATAPAVRALIDAGATLVGKTVTDELAWSLFGENPHYGTPRNAHAPGRVPGGSSAGSAAAVAAGAADLALGSDTGGSVRVPASFCGIWGFRPSHGRVAADGVMPLAPSFDTVGWFAREAELLRRVGLLLRDPLPAARPGPLLVGADAFALAGRKARPAFRHALAPVQRALGPGRPVAVASLDGHGTLADWGAVFRVLQAGEIWQVHGDWVRAARPAFGPGVRERFAAAAAVGAGDIARARAARDAISRHMDALLAGNAVLAVPSAPDIAPRRGIAGAAAEAFRARALAMLCIAGLARLPQVSLPLAAIAAGDDEPCPLGLGLVAGRGRDEMLLDLAIAIGRIRAGGGAAALPPGRRRRRGRGG